MLRNYQVKYQSPLSIDFLCSQLSHLSTWSQN
jgi:hypothetical protein